MFDNDVFSLFRLKASFICSLSSWVGLIDMGHAFSLDS